MHLQVVLQSITTVWTKASRGAPNATRRNSTPLALELPAFPAPIFEEELLLHSITYNERDSFRYPDGKWEAQSLKKPYRIDCLVLTLQENQLLITIQWERAEGQPRRIIPTRKTFLLQPSQWVRIAYNLRTSSYSGQWIYKKRIFHIGLFEPSASLRTFVESEPIALYEDFAHLR